MASSIRIRSLVAASVVALVGCECDDPIVTQIDPVLQVTPECLDFGTVELGQEALLPLTLKNLEAVPADIGDFSIEDNCDGCFLPIDPPARVVAFDTLQTNIRFRAVRVPVATGTVSITSNDPKAPTHKVCLKGRGSDLRKPDICVVPERVDFGFVPAGGVAIASFVVKSCGTNDLLIDRLLVDPEGAPFRITTSTPSPEHPGRLAPDRQASVSLRAELPMSATGTVTARILIESNVLEEKNVPGRRGVVQVPISALANLPPLAICGDDLTVDPWSRVTLDGSLSHDQDIPPDDPIRFRWTMRRKPDGSTTYLERASTSMPSFWADLTGSYELELVVTDALGLESAPATCVVDALPSNAIRIELTWDHPDADLDLHLMQQAGTFCDCTTDVHYRDCAREPNWFPTSPGANPRLDVDDQTGFGPENINIDGEGTSRFIPGGQYLIRVHYYASNQEISSWPTEVANATVRVYIFGLLAGEFSRAMMAPGELWSAARILWPEQRVEVDQGVLPGAVCGAF